MLQCARLCDRVSRATGMDAGQATTLHSPERIECRTSMVRKYNLGNADLEYLLWVLGIAELMLLGSAPIGNYPHGTPTIFCNCLSLQAAASTSYATDENYLSRSHLRTCCQTFCI